VRSILLFFSILVLLNGCATKISESNLYWGNYSDTLYMVKKEPGQASNAAHEKELQSIVKMSKELNLRVPPGIYAELGIFAQKRNEQKIAQSYFKLEQDTYPEAATVMQHTLLKKPKKSQEKSK
jgi:hypothetical protein